MVKRIPMGVIGFRLPGASQGALVLQFAGEHFERPADLISLRILEKLLHDEM